MHERMWMTRHHYYHIKFTDIFWEVQAMGGINWIFFSKCLIHHIETGLEIGCNTLAWWGGGGDWTGENLHVQLVVPLHSEHLMYNKSIQNADIHQQNCYWYKLQAAAGYGVWDSEHDKVWMICMWHHST